jgi:hypothetical protein
MCPCHKNEYLYRASISFSALLTGCLKSTMVSAEIHLFKRITGSSPFSLDKKINPGEAMSVFGHEKITCGG